MSWMVAIPISVVAMVLCGFTFWMDRHIAFAFFAALGIWFVALIALAVYAVLWLDALGVFA